jgi:hypothetical protein
MTKEWKTTQGHEKMLLYIQKLIRNKFFIDELKKIKESDPEPKGMYDTWTKEQKERSDFINKELGGIIEDYLKVKQRCEKLYKDKRWELQEKLTYEYGIDLHLLAYVRCLLDEEYKNIASHFEDYAEMCRIVNEFEEQIIPFNPGDDFIHLDPSKKTELIAYPVSIKINSLASKRDVMDFIEKRWNWIDNTLRQSKDEKALKIKRKRKHSQALLDFIWENRELPAMAIKKKIDKKFPNNGLVYYEISKLIQLEKMERLEE